MKIESEESRRAYLRALVIKTQTFVAGLNIEDENISIVNTSQKMEYWRKLYRSVDTSLLRRNMNV